ncbi:hypothetical protein Tco_0484124 [Tanacetum coccineum]
MYKEYLAKFWYSAKALENSKVSFSIPTGGIYNEVGVNTFRNAIGAHYIPHSSEYVAPPSINIVRPWFEIIGYGETVPTKGTLKKSLLPPRWSATELVVFKAPKPSSNVERVPQGTKPEAKLGHKKHSTSSKQSFVSSKEVTKGGSSKPPISSKTSHYKKRKDSSSAMDSNPIQPLASFIIHSEFASRNDALAVSTAKADPENSAANLDSPEDDPVIIVNDSDEDEEDEVHTTTNDEIKDTSVPKSSSPRSLPTELKDLPSKFDELTKEVKGLKKQVHELDIELPGDLKEIPTKLEKFTKTVTSLTSQVAKLKNLH